MDEFIEAGQRIIKCLTEDQSINWFVDANVLQSGWVEQHFNPLSNVITTEEIVQELRKRTDEAKSGLRVVSQLNDANQIAASSWFKDKHESFQLLMDAATQLAPSIRVRTIHIMESELISHEIAEEKAINQLAHEGDFFASAIMEIVRELEFANEHIMRVAKSTRRSWFRHPAKRRAKISKDDFIQSDERLVGFAAANLFLNGKRTCIVSNDTDYDAILKQFTDNLLWVASVIECEKQESTATLNSVVQFWELHCKELNGYRTSCGMQLAKAVYENEDIEDLNVHGPAKNELLVCRPSDGHISRFAFPEKLVLFVNDFKLVSSWHSLEMNGFWLPKKSI